MLTSYINDSMRQYERWAENEIVTTKPKHSKPHGIKRPDARKIVAAAAIIIAICVVIIQLTAWKRLWTTFDLQMQWDLRGSFMKGNDIVFLVVLIAAIVAIYILFT